MEGSLIGRWDVVEASSSVAEIVGSLVLLSENDERAENCRRVQVLFRRGVCYLDSSTLEHSLASESSTFHRYESSLPYRR